jgi:hypothetical protein
MEQGSWRFSARGWVLDELWPSRRDRDSRWRASAVWWWVAWVLVGLVISVSLAPAAGAAGSPAGEAGDPGPAFPDIDLGDDLLLVEDHPVDFDHAYPGLVPSDLAVEHRAFAGGQRRTYVSLVAPMSVMIVVVDLSEHEAAALSVRSPQSLVPEIPSSADVPVGDPSPRRDVRRTATGQASVRTLIAHGRTAVRIEVVGPQDRRSDLESVSERVVAQVTAQSPPPDRRRVQPPPSTTDITSQAFTMVWIWYLLGLAVVALKDWRLLGQRLKALIVRRRRVPLELPGVTVVPVEATARLLRWRSSFGAVVWWATRVFGVILGTTLVLTSAFRSAHDNQTPVGVAIVAAAIVLALPVAAVGGLVALLRWRRRARGNRFAQDLYRRLRQRVGWPVRAGTGAIASVVIGLLVLTTVGVGGFEWYLKTLDLPPPLDFTAGLEIGSGLLVLTMALLSLPWRALQRRARAGIDRVVDEDGRPAIPLLRSFDDDKIELTTRRGGRHSLIDRLSLRRRDRFEEIVAWTLWRHGPLAAAAPLGAPPGRWPAFGAARSHLPKDEKGWKQEILRLIDEAGMVAVIVGKLPRVPRDPCNRDWLAWEIQELKHRRALPRTIFVFPPDSDDRADERLWHLAGVLNPPPPSPADWPPIPVPLWPQHTGNGHVLLAMTIDADSRITLYTGRFRDDVSYRLALEQAVERLPPHSTLPAAPRPQSLPPLEPPPKPHVVPWALPALATLFLAWMFILTSGHELSTFLTDRSPHRAPYSLPGIGTYAPAWGVAADADHTVSWDLTGDIQIFTGEPATDQRFELQEAPTAGAIDGAHAVFAHLPANQLTVVDVADPTRRRTVDVPSPLALAADDGIVVSASGLDRSLSIVDHTSDSGSARTLGLDGTPVAVALSGGRAVVADAAGDQVIVVDLASATIVDRFPVCHGPRDLETVGETVTVVCELDAVVAGYALDGRQLDEQAVGHSPFDVARTSHGLAVLDRGDPSVVLIDGPQTTTLRTWDGTRQLAVRDSLLLLASPNDERISIYDLDEDPQRRCRRSRPGAPGCHRS